MKKSLWYGQYTYDVTWEEGHWFWKKEIRRNLHWTPDKIILAANAEEAQEKFKNLSCYQHPSPFAFPDICNVPEKYTVLNVSIEVSPCRENFESLKSNMYPDEFLAYCRQELVDIETVIK